MASDCLIQKLPQEIIEHILENEQISINDVCNFSLTCKQFIKLKGSLRLWKIKCSQRPLLRKFAKMYEKEKLNPLERRDEWTEMNYSVRRELHCNFKKRIEENFHKHYLSPRDFYDHKLVWDRVTQNELLIVMDELHDILDKYRGINVAYQCNAKQMLRFVNQARVTFNWQEELLEGPEENQLLEKLGLCVAEWFQPEDQDLESQCTAKLDEIAWRIKEELRVTNPEHLLFKVPESVQNQWRTKMLPDNEFDVTHSQEILRCALQVMVSTLEFTRDNYDPEKFNNEVICLNKVLESKRGDKNILLIIFESAVRRLGVRCEVVRIGSKLLLRWKQTYKNWSNNLQRVYLDCDSLMFVPRNFIMQTWNNLPDYFQTIEVNGVLPRPETTFEKVMESIAEEWFESDIKSNSDQPYLAFILLAKPHSHRGFEALAQFYIDKEMDMCDLIDLLEDERDEHPSSVMIKMQRPELLSEMKNCQKQYLKQKNVNQRQIRTQYFINYAIGFILFQKFVKRYCVVIGWKTRWELKFTDDKLFGKFDAIYLVIYMDNGEYNYIEQDDLQLVKPTESLMKVQNFQVNKYFSNFNRLCYVPTQELAMRYPQDIKARKRLFQHFRLPPRAWKDKNKLVSL